MKKRVVGARGSAAQIYLPRWTGGRSSNQFIGLFKEMVRIQN